MLVQSLSARKHSAADVDAYCSMAGPASLSLFLQVVLVGCCTFRPIMYSCNCRTPIPAWTATVK
jgi:hypothetical protein